MILDNKVKSVFPNLDTLAFYDTFSQYIKLNYISEADYSDLLGDFSTGNKNKNTEIFIHEFQHWYDHNSTLWGLKNQASLFNAYNIRLQPTHIKKYNEIPKLIREIEKEYLLAYYYEKYQHIVPKNIEERWRMRHSIGYRFNHNGEIDELKPLSFIRFLSYTGERVCRTPISLASLLESNAIAAEIEVQLKYMVRLTGEQLMSEMDLLDREYFKWLYNPDMTLYSVAAHLVSNTSGIKNVINSFLLSKSISTLALNIPKKLYPSITIPSHFTDYQERNKHLLEDGDIGHLFHCLLINSKEFFKEGGEIDISGILSRSNLPNEKELLLMIEEEIEELEQAVIDGPFRPRVKRLLQSGKILLKNRGLFDQGKLDFSIMNENKILPLVIFSDTIISFDGLSANTIFDKLMGGQKIDISEYIYCTKYASEKLYEFFNICGI